VRLTELTEVYWQQEDCCAPVNEGGQTFTISTQNGGGGSYLVISTERWALDSAKEIDDFARKLKAILARINKEEAE